MSIQHLRWKLIQRPILPIGGSYIDALPFLILLLLLLFSGYALRNKKLGKTRVLLQVIALLFFIFTFHRCFGALRGWLFSLENLAKDDISTFYNLFVFVPLVSFTIMFGRIFCGWVCPLGTIQESTFRIPVLKRFIIKDSVWLKSVKPLAFIPLFILTPLLLIKLRPQTFFFTENIAAFWGGALIFIVFIGLCKPQLEPRLKKIRYLSLTLWIFLILLDIYVTDPWCVLYGNVLDYSSLIALFAVVASSFFIFMPWCRYLCPLGSFLGLLARFSQLKIKQKAKLPAEKIRYVCPVEALAGESFDQSSCLYCSRCVQAGASEIKES